MDSPFGSQSSPFINEIVKASQFIVQTVRDSYGFPKGVVVACGKDRLGCSLVNRSEDVRWQRLKPTQLPAIQRMLQKEIPWNLIVKSKAYKKAERADHAIAVPLFNRRIGILLALDSAKRNEISVWTEMVEEPRFACKRMPYDEELHDVLLSVYNRAQKHF